jgi:hypothetical protein
MRLACVCITLPLYFIYHNLPCLSYSLLLKRIVMIMYLESLLHHAILWENINNDTRIIIRVKCFNGISVRLWIYSINIKTNHHGIFGAVAWD